MVGIPHNRSSRRTTFASGWAAYEVGMAIRRQLVERAARIWECTPEDVEYGDGVLTCKTDAEKKLTFKELAGQVQRTGAPVSASASVAPTGVGVFDTLKAVAKLVLTELKKGGP